MTHEPDSSRRCCRLRFPTKPYDKETFQCMICWGVYVYSKEYDEWTRTETRKDDPLDFWDNIVSS